MPASAPVYGRRAALRSLACAAAGVALPAWAAGPARTVRLLVGQPAGDIADRIARLIAEPMSRALQQAVVVENRPGAGGSAAAVLVAQSAPDALTLLLSQTTALAVAPFAADKPPYDPLEAFTHLSGVARAPLVLVAHPSAQLNSLADLEARARKASLGFATSGAGSLAHVYGELVKSALGLNLVHMPTRGASAARDVSAGAVPLGVESVAAVLPHFQKGELVPVAVTGSERSPLMPDIPTVTDFGQSRLVLDDVYGMSAPARLPAAHAARLAAALTQALASADLRGKLETLGAAALPVSPGAFSQQVRQQVAQLGPVVKSAGIRAAA